MKLSTRITRLERQPQDYNPVRCPAPRLDPDLLARVQALKASGNFPVGLSDADLEALMRAARGEVSR